MFKFIQRWFGKIETVGSRFALSLPFSRYSHETWNYFAHAKEGYQENPYIYRGINFLAEGVGSLPWYAYEEKPGIDGKTVNEDLASDHPLSVLLNRPNPELYLGTSNFMQTMVTYLLLGGVAPCLKVRSGSGGEDGLGTGETKLLQPVQPDQFDVKRGKAFNPIAGFEYKPPNRGAKNLLKENVIYIRVFNPIDLINGFPPIAACAKAVDMLNKADLWNLSLLNNDCRPPGMFKVNAHLDDDDFEEGKRRLRSQLMGAENAGTPMLGDSDLDWVPFSYTPAEMNYENLTLVKAREISLVLNVPPKIMGESESQNYASLSAAIKQGIIEGVLPIADMLKQELTIQLASEFGDNIKIGYRRDEIEALQEERSALWERVNGADALTVDEKRQELGYDELPDGIGNVVMYPSTSMPLDMLTDPGEESEE